MTVQISVHGRLIDEIKTSTSSNNNSVAFGRMVANIPCRDKPEGKTALWLSVVAFGKVADSLARHTNGDLISLSGSLNARVWNKQDGTSVDSYQVIADAIISARTARPAGGRKKAQKQSAPQQEQEDFTDEDIPF